MSVWYGFFNDDEHATEEFTAQFSTVHSGKSADYLKYSFVCFGWYPSHYERRGKRKEFYFALPMRDWYKNVVDEFNGTFNNIKVEVVSEIPYNRIYSSYYGSIADVRIDNPAKGRIEFIGKFVLFHIKIDEGYNKSPRYLFPVLIGMYIRMHSRAKTFIVDDYKEQYLAKTIDKNNEPRQISDEYTMSGYPLTMDLFLKLDDVDLMNRTFSTNLRGVKFFSSDYGHVGVGYKVHPYSVYYVLDHLNKQFDRAPITSDESRDGFESDMAGLYPDYNYDEDPNADEEDEEDEEGDEDYDD